jgi:hypothetical protein
VNYVVVIGIVSPLLVRLSQIKPAGKSAQLDDCTMYSRLNTASSSSLPSNSATSEEDTATNHGFSETGNSRVHRSDGEMALWAGLAPNTCFVNALGAVVVSVSPPTANVRLVETRNRDMDTGSAGRKRCLL